MNFLRRLRGDHGDAPGPTRTGDLADIYVGLRDKILSLDPSSAGIEPTDRLPDVWGVVMDWSLDRGAATIVSLADGTTSMYLSSGGGTIGAGAHKDAAAASINALQVAQTMVDDFPVVQSVPMPGPARTGVTLLTFSGLRRIEDDNAAFQQGTAKGSALANAMQGVIHEIRRAGETRPNDIA